jgi:hypothetical protein
MFGIIFDIIILALISFMGTYNLYYIATDENAPIALFVAFGVLIFSGFVMSASLAKDIRERDKEKEEYKNKIEEEKRPIFYDKFGNELKDGDILIYRFANKDDKREYEFVWYDKLKMYYLVDPEIPGMSKRADEIAIDKIFKTLYKKEVYYKK